MRLLLSVSVILVISSIWFCSDVVAWEKTETFDDPARYPGFDDGNGFFEGRPYTTITHVAPGDCFSGRCVEVYYDSPGEAWIGYSIDLGTVTNYFKATYYLKIHPDHSPNDLKWMRFYPDRFSGEPNFLLKIRHSSLVFETETLYGTGNTIGTFSFADHINEWHKVTVEVDNRNPSDRTFKVWVDDILDISLTHTSANDFRSIQGSYFSISAGNRPAHYSIDEYSITTDPNDAEGTVHVYCDFNTPPSSEDQGGVYTCPVNTAQLFYGSNQVGPVFDHAPTEGWQGSGGAKFYTHLAAQSYGNSYRQLNFGSYSSPDQQNLRYLLKVENGGSEDFGGKWHLSDGSQGWRTWMGHGMHGGVLGGVHPEISYHNTVYMTHGDGATEGFCSSEGYRCCQHPNTWTSEVSSCTQVEPDLFYFTDYEDEWVCFELERHGTGEYKIYVWTQDGTQSGLYYWLDTTFDENLGPAPLGAYLENPNAIGKYFIFDEAVVSDSFIGPPLGFISGSPPTYACSDGSDNDGDGQPDYPLDPGCSSSTDNSEYGSAECDDGSDNDGDGDTDYRVSGGDGGCSSLTDNDETNCPDGQCEGGETPSTCPADCGSTSNNCIADLGGTCCSSGQTCQGGSFSASDDCSSLCCVGAGATCEDVTGVTINVDSTYGGYNTQHIDDGIVDPYNSESSTWASGQSVTDSHWVEFVFGQPVYMRNVTIYWAYNNFRSAFMTSQEVWIQYWDGSGFVNATVIHNPLQAESSSVRFPVVSTERIRVWQPANMSYYEYPAVMWLTEIDYHGFHRADNDPQNSCIEQPELIDFIGLWFTDSTENPMWELMEAVMLHYQPC